MTSSFESFPESFHPTEKFHAFDKMNSSGKRFGTLLEMKDGEVVEADAVEEPSRRATAAQMAARR